ncbi:MAG: alpha-L-rhamnosidase N-terminal domain-containing protein [Kiritimatiellales bacterium]|nr:alpha-L-rhamnosidase N-terminal domain-containing protein [Kiritimatiellales bacterium]
MKRYFVAGMLGILAVGVVSAEYVPWEAKWIWQPDAGSEFNSWMLARREFRVGQPVEKASIRITADTKYQLFINGQFVSDGPVRAFPSHYRYDTVDVSAHLKPGINVIGVRVHHWGRDTAQNIAVRPGLLAQMEWQDSAGKHVIGTDQTWRVCRDLAHDPRSPIVSAHLGFEEQYDARMEHVGWLASGFDDSAWAEAEEIAPALEGPWLDLRPREIPQLAKTPITPVAVLDVKQVRPPRIVSTVNLGLSRDIARKADNRNWYRYVLVSTIHSEAGQQARVLRPSAGFRAGLYRLAGKEIDVRNFLLDAEETEVQLQKGDNPLIVVIEGPSETEEFQFRLDADAPVTLRNPFGKGQWAVTGTYGPKDARWKKMKVATTLKELEPLRNRFRDLEPREIISADVHGQTCQRAVLGQGNVTSPQGLASANEEMTVIPAGDAAVELMIDFGKEYNAHIGLELDAPAGVVIDGNIFERFHEGKPQWPWRNRSSFRYTTKAGPQRYTTMRHFGGRYLALTVRARTAEVRIRRVFGEFTHYPVADRGRFHCSDALLNNVWSISRQTMLSCMEDTFVDCPLYEQSYWQGDARNEALVCYRMFGDPRLVRRCCTLGVESLETNDLSGMRLPTRWGRIIPAWNFLWQRMCWENYWYSGNKQILTERYYPAVRKMLNTCLDKYTDPATGLFAIKAWNFFDWIGLDNGHKCVTHNNTFLVDSLRLGAKMADLADDAVSAEQFRKAANELAANINRHLWDEQRGAYIDSIHDDGTKSTSVSRQINTLALLHGVVPPDREARVLSIALGEQTENVVQFGSPFATLYLLEFLGETGRVEPMLNTIRELWGSMMDEQTTTFWESFATGNLGGSRYPTRSYCPAWSPGPAYVFSRYVLGVRLDEPAGRAVTITPRLDVLGKAEGIVPLPDGKIVLSWDRSKPDDARIIVDVQGPETATLVLSKGWKLSDHPGSELLLKQGRQVLQVQKF